MNIKITEEENSSLREAAEKMMVEKTGTFPYNDKGARQIYYAEVPQFGWILAIDVSPLTRAKTVPSGASQVF